MPEVVRLKHYDSICRIDEVCGKEPDETSIGNVRRLTEEYKLARSIFDAITDQLQVKGARVSAGTIVDATIIEAQSSTENQDGERDTVMHQTKKGSKWHFEMKAHMGVDANNKMIPSVDVPAANVHDRTMIRNLLSESDVMVWGDKANVATKAAITEAVPYAVDCTM